MRSSVMGPQFPLSPHDEARFGRCRAAVDPQNVLPSSPYVTRARFVVSDQAAALLEILVPLELDLIASDELFPRRKGVPAVRARIAAPAASKYGASGGITTGFRGFAPTICG
jgi:hypothetical protein